eukprot:CAMPEP_0117535098 /NCGR_PEP_ID=MMETSP0784-20121206/40758_1 /TAXON_ID=39447 /ORGANISM="" /LENGTH=148 /DNA_ID=CAMNT_0005331611 /DNA_START=337 /DNA_END=783 /DNA_ORIENTATION=+
MPEAASTRPIQTIKTMTASQRDLLNRAPRGTSQSESAVGRSKGRYQSAPRIATTPSPALDRPTNTAVQALGGLHAAGREAAAAKTAAASNVESTSAVWRRFAVWPRGGPNLVSRRSTQSAAAVGASAPAKAVQAAAASACANAAALPT